MAAAQLASMGARGGSASRPARLLQPVLRVALCSVPLEEERGVLRRSLGEHAVVGRLRDLAFAAGGGGGGLHVGGSKAGMLWSSSSISV